MTKHIKTEAQLEKLLALAQYDPPADQKDTPFEYRDIHFKHVTFNRVHLSNVVFHDCSFRNVSFLNATFEDSAFTQTTFEHVSMHHATFSNCTMDRTQFLQVVFLYSALQDVVGKRMRFRNINAHYLQWLNAHMPGLSLHECTFNAGTWADNNMPNSILQYTTFNDVTLRNIDWTELSATNLVLIGSLVKRTKLSDAHINGTLIKDCIFEHSALEDAYIYMTDVEISGSPSIPAVSATLYTPNGYFPLTYFPGIDLCVTQDGSNTLEDAFALLRTRLQSQDSYQDNIAMQLALIEAQWRNIDFELLDDNVL